MTISFSFFSDHLALEGYTYVAVGRNDLIFLLHTYPSVGVNDTRGGWFSFIIIIKGVLGYKGGIFFFHMIPTNGLLAEREVVSSFHPGRLFSFAFLCFLSYVPKGGKIGCCNVISYNGRDDTRQVATLGVMS